MDFEPRNVKEFKRMCRKVPQDEQLQQDLKRTLLEEINHVDPCSNGNHNINCGSGITPKVLIYSNLRTKGEIPERPYHEWGCDSPERARLLAASSQPDEVKMDFKPIRWVHRRSSRRPMNETISDDGTPVPSQLSLDIEASRRTLETPNQQGQRLKLVMRPRIPSPEPSENPRQRLKLVTKPRSPPPPPPPKPSKHRTQRLKLFTKPRLPTPEPPQQRRQRLKLFINPRLPTPEPPQQRKQRLKLFMNQRLRTPEPPKQRRQRLKLFMKPRESTPEPSERQTERLVLKRRPSTPGLLKQEEVKQEETMMEIDS